MLFTAKRSIPIFHTQPKTQQKFENLLKVLSGCIFQLFEITTIALSRLYPFMNKSICCMPNNQLLRIVEIVSFKLIQINSYAIRFFEFWSASNPTRTSNWIAISPNGSLNQDRLESVCESWWPFRAKCDNKNEKLVLVSLLLKIGQVP